MKSEPFRAVAKHFRGVIVGFIGVAASLFAAPGSHGLIQVSEIDRCAALLADYLSSVLLFFLGSCYIR